jgi:hypothetical protein
MALFTAAAEGDPTKVYVLVQEDVDLNAINAVSS